jgi:hypothetical protein
MSTVSVPDAARSAGLSYRQVSHWVALGAIKPALGTGGSGHPYRFTETQAEHLRQIGSVYRLLERMEVDPTVDFVRSVWASLEETGTFRCTEGPVVITLPWPPLPEAEGPPAS